MSIADFVFWSQEFGIILGTLIALFVVSDRITKIAVFLIERWRKNRLESRLRAILIVPNLEEIAKYSIQEPQRNEINSKSQSEILEAARAEEIELNKRAKSQIRVFTVFVAFAIGFTIIGVRYILIALG